MTTTIDITENFKGQILLRTPPASAGSYFEQTPLAKVRQEVEKYATAIHGDVDAVVPRDSRNEVMQGFLERSVLESTRE